MSLEVFTVSVYPFVPFNSYLYAVVPAGNPVITSFAFTGVASQEITISETLSTGLYWLAFCQQGTAPTTATYSGNSGSATIFNYLIPFSGAGSLNASNIIGYTSNPHTGAFPSTPTFGVAAAAAFVWLRTA